jgi:hypothetical protein
VDLDEILYGSNDAKDDIYFILLNFVALTTPNCERLNFRGGANFELIGGFEYEVLYGGDAIRDDLCSILLNPVA